MLPMNYECSLTGYDTLSTAFDRHGTAHVREAVKCALENDRGIYAEIISRSCVPVAPGTFAASGANAMPIGSVTPTASGVDRLRRGWPEMP